MHDALIDERLALFAFAHADGRRRYLAILRAFERARDHYELQLSPEQVAEAMSAGGDAERVPEDLRQPLDQLVQWGVLSRTQDGGRVRSLAEYRRRRSIYQATELGWMAWRAVEGVLQASPGEAELQRLVLPAVLEDLRALARANEREEPAQVYVLLDRLHTTLDQLAERASRFYLAMGEITRTQDATAERFLEHKERLLAHLTDFLTALQDHGPRLAQAVREVERTGRERLIAQAAAADSSVFAHHDEKQARWSSRWAGVAAWFCGSETQASQVRRLDSRTASAIRDLVALLRQVTEARRGGVSRASQLEVLARWFHACPDLDAAQALVGLVFTTRGTRHLSLPEADAGDQAPSTGWWDAAPVHVEANLRRHGRRGSPGRPQPVVLDPAAARRVARAHQARRQADRQATSQLAERLALGRPLVRQELEVLLGMLGRALQTRQAVTGSLAGTAATDGVQLRLTLADRDTVIDTELGVLTLQGVSLALGRDEASP